MWVHKLCSKYFSPFTHLHIQISDWQSTKEKCNFIDCTFCEQMFLQIYLWNEYKFDLQTASFKSITTTQNPIFKILHAQNNTFCLRKGWVWLSDNSWHRAEGKHRGAPDLWPSHHQSLVTAFPLELSWQLCGVSCLPSLLQLFYKGLSLTMHTICTVQKKKVEL